MGYTDLNRWHFTESFWVLLRTKGKYFPGMTMKKIALEEHFVSPGFEEYWAPTVGNIDRTIYNRVLAQLNDFGDLRLDAMERGASSLIWFHF
jgi:hypothetical protein